MGDEVASSSPKNNKVKFLCSHGGKILPRPSDGLLKYVGGETRVVAVPRTISYSELKKKLTSLVDGDTVLKYQLIPEDLDALVSVTCDEDLKHMLEEHDRQDAKASGNSSSSGGSPRLRAFLFPPTPYLINETNHSPYSNTTNDVNAMEQRYIDAVNGVVRATTNVGRPIFTISSAGSSPKSNAPDASFTAETTNQDTVVLCDGIGNQFSRTFSRTGGMHRVRSSPSMKNIIPKAQSSPSLLSLGGQQQHNQHHHYHHQPSRLPHMPATPATMVAPSEVGMGQHSRYYSPVCGHQRMSGACLGCEHHANGLRAFRSGSGFSAADNNPQMGAEGFRWIEPPAWARPWREREPS